MLAVPRWAVVSSATAPVLLVGGWTLAALRQPAGYRSTVQTISSLAAIGTPDRWIMTWALVGVGLCHLVTALGLRPAAVAGRLFLGLGGLGTLGVAAFPLSPHAPAAAHTLTAEVAFLSLAAWPAIGALADLLGASPARDAGQPAGRDAGQPAGRDAGQPAGRDAGQPAGRAPADGRPSPRAAQPAAPPWSLRPVVATVVSAVLLGLVACFFAVVDGGPLVGLVERVAAGAQSVWPLVVVGSILARRDRAAAPVGAGRRS